ncbi:hypothetical protein [Paracoccus sp. pheM1]|uniref:hypothetical protein n=1 Tax=Paracoccus sp. pheM1 TaxID=2831675 RepID=UPI001BDB9146|nr:hypothetical protein [Paracoccus sp. pheM1]MBT0780533.1 hypothetical protein [Paracoccus sp. pheM1]
MTDAQITPEVVERYVMEAEDDKCVPVRDPWGRWVRASDYDALAQENAALKAENERLSDLYHTQITRNEYLTIENAAWQKSARQMEAQAAAIEAETIERCAELVVPSNLRQEIRALPRVSDPDALKRAVDAAVLAERQACAEIAENRAQAYEAQKALPLRNITLLDQKADTARIIAAAILARTETSHD